jgi:hypothetical protein
VALEQLAANLQRRGESADAHARSYAAAVAFARAFTLTEEPNRRASLAKKTLALLHTLKTEGYFQTLAHAAALREEPAFAGLRNWPGFPQE